MTEDELKDVVCRLEAVVAITQARPREYLGAEDAAAFLTLSKVQLDEWRSRRTGGPPFHRIGKRVVYGIADLRSWMQAHRQEPMA